MIEQNNKNKFPLVSEEITFVGDKYKRCALYYPLLRKCLENAQTGKSVADLLFNMGIFCVGLYAVNEFTDYVLRDRNLSKLSEVRVYDRNYEKFQGFYAGKLVNSTEEAVKDYNKSMIKKIIICNLTSADEIYKDFINRKINKRDILTIDMLIYGMG